MNALPEESQDDGEAKRIGELAGGLSDMGSMADAQVRDSSFRCSPQSFLFQLDQTNFCSTSPTQRMMAAISS